MSETRRTPGPWRSEWRHPDLAVWGGPDDEHVASIYGDGTIENAEANARLIAAAPELLSSLRLIVSCLRREEHWPIKGEHMGYLADCEAAIAKAEGVK